MLQTSALSVEEGVPGDDWHLRPPREQDAQLAVMQFDLARLIAGEQSILLFGDQLFVDLDLASDSLPTDSLIQVGTARVRVTPPRSSQPSEATCVASQRVRRSVP